MRLVYTFYGKMVNKFVLDEGKKIGSFAIYSVHKVPVCFSLMNSPLPIPK